MDVTDFNHLVGDAHIVFGLVLEFFECLFLKIDRVDSDSVAAPLCLKRKFLVMRCVNEYLFGEPCCLLVGYFKYLAVLKELHRVKIFTGLVLATGGLP